MPTQIRNTQPPWLLGNLKSLGALLLDLTQSLNLKPNIAAEHTSLPLIPPRPLYLEYKLAIVKGTRERIVRYGVIDQYL